MEKGYVSLKKEISLLLTIYRLYEQQQHMFDHKTHSVPDRIVSISQPWIRPIVRGKLNSPVEFGVKLDISIDTRGYRRMEETSFDIYNESIYLKNKVQRYKERIGHYPKRILADQIYRTRDNHAFCKEYGIRLSGPKLGNPNLETSRKDKNLIYLNNTDRSAIEREFSREKRCYGLGKIVTQLETTQLTSITLSVFVVRRKVGAIKPAG